jgi:putative zinc binding protein
LRVPEKGCALCEATWGDYWEEVEGQQMLFCCDICATEFKNMVRDVKARTGWKSIDEIKMRGDYRGRDCTAVSGDRKYSFFISFDSRGEVQDFKDHLKG